MNPWILAIPLSFAAYLLFSKKSQAAAGEPKLLSPIPSTSPEKISTSSPAMTSQISEAEYPQTMRALAEKWAPIFLIPSEWMISQAYAESRNRPLAVNPSGTAFGILQIKLGTANDISRWLKQSSWKNDPRVMKVLAEHWHGQKKDLFNPTLNAMMAAFYMGRLKSIFGNDHRLIAAAYNQGPNVVRKALRNKTQLPVIALEYVARVQEAKKKGYV